MGESIHKYIPTRSGGVLRVIYHGRCFQESCVSKISFLSLFGDVFPLNHDYKRKGE